MNEELFRSQVRVARQTAWFGRALALRNLPALWMTLICLFAVVLTAVIFSIEWHVIYTPVKVVSASPECLQRVNGKFNCDEISIIVEGQQVYGFATEQRVLISHGRAVPERRHCEAVRGSIKSISIAANERNMRGVSESTELIEVLVKISSGTTITRNDTCTNSLGLAVSMRTSLFKIAKDM